MRMLLYFFVKPRQDTVLLEHRFYFFRGPVWWVSVWSTEWGIWGENVNVTWFCCRDLPRWYVPRLPISLTSSLSVVSACVEYWVSNIRRECQCYRIFVQSISKILCSFVTDLTEIKVQCGECLREVLGE